MGNVQRRTHGVPGPDGLALTKDSLPAPGVTRWVARRKAEIVIAVRSGLLGFDEACTRYALSPEEFLGWNAAYDKRGLFGLKARWRA